jgi:hypothetical protein
LADFARRYADCELLVINTALRLPRAMLDHMALSDVKSLLEFSRPKVAVITHMGGEMLDLPEEYVSRRLSTNKTRAFPARDGMIINIGDLTTADGKNYAREK